MNPEDKPADDKSGPTPPEPAPKPDDKPADTPNPLQSELDAANNELEKLRKAQKERDDADLSEKDREKQRADEAEARANTSTERLRRVAIIQAVRDAAPGEKVDVDVDAIRDLYDAGAFKDIKLDDKTGDPIGIADKLKALVKSKPYIVKKTVAAPAPDINADKKGDEKPGEMTDDRKAALAKRFRLKK